MLKQKTQFDTVVIHYDEIGLKGKNRRYFEELLEKNIRSKLQDKIKGVKRERGRVTLTLDANSDFTVMEEVLKTTPGISYFSFAKRCPLDIVQIENLALELAEEFNFETFRVSAKRSNKGFPLDSNEINIRLGTLIHSRFNKSAKMKGADFDLKVEIGDKSAYLSVSNIRGIGGLPTDKANRVLALISGGFDSPVAAYMMMKRGCQVDLVHFINSNLETTSVKSKVRQISETLSKFQTKTTLYIVPFEELQKQLIMKVHSEKRMLIYRRYMLKIASQIADKLGVRFLVVGDSLSQVASQTIENLEATYEGSEKHVLSPIIGLNKTEIIDTARKIGTYDISKLPHEDCCSYFTPKHPELRANSNELSKIEKQFDSETLIQDAIDNLEKIEF